MKSLNISTDIVHSSDQENQSYFKCRQHKKIFPVLIIINQLHNTLNNFTTLIISSKRHLQRNKAGSLTKITVVQ